MKIQSELSVYLSKIILILEKSIEKKDIADKLGFLLKSNEILNPQKKTKDTLFLKLLKKRAQIKNWEQKKNQKEEEISRQEKEMLYEIDLEQMKSDSKKEYIKLNKELYFYFFDFL